MVQSDWAVPGVPDADAPDPDPPEAAVAPLLDGAEVAALADGGAVGLADDAAADPAAPEELELPAAPELVGPHPAVSIAAAARTVPVSVIRREKAVMALQSLIRVRG